MASKKSAARGARRVSAGATRVSAPSKKKAAPAAKKAASSPAAKKAARAPAAPLLARAPKKTGKVTGAAKPKAPYQPKSEPPPLAFARRAVAPAALPAALNPLALATPWMRLGLQMTLAGIAMQTRVARAVLEQPAASTALRQGTAAFDAWRTWLAGVPPPTDAKS